MKTELAVDLQHVAKTYRGKVHALQGISMQLRRGEIFGLLGPNGAGKSTLVKIIMTVVRPTKAVGTVLGQPIGHKPTLARVGYLPENHRFPRYLTGRQVVEFFGALAKVDRRTIRRRSDELLHLVGMSNWGNRKISTYSKGMMQRIGLAQAMVNDPDLIVLDEPTDGVDPLGRREIRDVLVQLRQRGKTVFINSHLLNEREMISDRVAILVGGRVARQGTVEELTRGQQRYEIEVATPPASASTIRNRLSGILTEMGAEWADAAPPPAPELPTAGKRPPLPPAVEIPLRGQMPGGIWIEVQGTCIRIGTADPMWIQPILDAVRLAGLTLRRVMPIRQTLEELFMSAVIDPVTGRAVLPGAGMATGAAPALPVLLEGAAP